MSEAVFVKNPISVRALQFTGDNLVEMQNFVGNIPEHDDDTLGFRLAVVAVDEPDIIARVWDKLHGTWVGVKKDQWIIQGIKGEFYPCDPDVFAETYSPIEETREDTRTFSQDLASLINYHSLENGSDTPDFILASFLQNVLTDWNHAVSARATWRGEGVS